MSMSFGEVVALVIYGLILGFGAFGAAGGCLC